jgi:sulfofructosephosphate aldolase
VTPTLDALARPSGTFLMVAMDQRESLRTMMGGDAPDERLVGFKLAVARELSPHASAFLIDRHFGFDRVVREGLAACSVILAADALDDAGGVVQETEVDEAVDPEGAAALKFLVIWRDDAERGRRLEKARRFVELAESFGLLSVLEGIVRVPEEERDERIVEAAAELSSAGPSLYKVEVPQHGRGDADAITRRCREIDAVVPMPWVVLSNGVELADFPRAVEASCRGGASGMLAGRAIWSDLVNEPDPAPLLREVSVPRLEQLAEIVDREGRPWRERRC